MKTINCWHCNITFIQEVLQVVHESHDTEIVEVADDVVEVADDVADVSVCLFMSFILGTLNIKD